MRLVLGLPRRHARVLLPRARRPGRRPQRDHGRGDRRRRRPPRRPAGDGRRRRRPVRLLHAGLRRRQRTTCWHATRADRARDPRGAGRQPVPLHGLREDHRRGQARVRADVRRHERPDAPPPRRPAPRPDRRDHHADRRRAEGPGRVRVLERHARRRDAVGRDAAQPAPARGHLVDRHQRGGRDARRARRAHPRRRARPQDLRDGDRRPARAGLEDDPLPGRGDRDRRRRRSRDRAPRGEGDQGRIRACCRR